MRMVSIVLDAIRRHFLIVVACLFVAATVSAMPARAATNAAADHSRAQSQRTAEVVVTARMHVVGFDAAVAAAHGYVIRTTPAGQQYAVKEGSSAVSVTPEDVSVGDCGISYVYEYGIGNRAVELYTGFSVEYEGVTAVVDGHWQVRLSDRGGTSFKNWNVPATANGIWQVDQVVGGLTRGPAQAKVVSAASWALLANGAVCYSGGPSATTTIT